MTINQIACARARACANQRTFLAANQRAANRSDSRANGDVFSLAVVMAIRAAMSKTARRNR